MPKPLVRVWTDGACRGNPGPGGWAAILVNDKTGEAKEISGRHSDTTNNRMEITAVIKALGILKTNCIVELTTDSMNVVYGIRGIAAKGNHWIESHENRDLWRKIKRLMTLHEVNVHWTRGHGDDAVNNRVDQLAKEVI